MGTVWRSFFFEKFLILFFYRFLTFSDNIPVFCRKFFVTAVRTAFWLSKGTFWENCSSETFFPFAQWAKNFGLSSQKVFAHSSKWHPRRPEAQFGEECFFVLKKKLFFFQCFCTSVKTDPSSVEKISGVLSKMHCACPWKQFAEEDFFCEKIFFIRFEHWAMCLPFLKFSRVDLSKLHSKCPIAFQGKFLWENFNCYFGTLIQNFLVFYWRFSGGIVKMQYKSPRVFSEKKYFYSGKKQFLLSCSDTDPILFRPFVNIFSTGSSKLNHKCPIAIPGNKFFWKNFWSVSELERMCSSFFSKKIQS